MKNAAPVEAKRYILQNRLFRKKYKKYSQNLFKIHQTCMKKWLQKQVWIREADPFPIFSNLFQPFPTFGPKKAFNSPDP